MEREASSGLMVDLIVETKKAPKRLIYMRLLAEEEGFEPSVDLHLRLISSQVHSTTLPPLRSVRRYSIMEICYLFHSNLDIFYAG